jgi:hypothetical protein
VSLDELRPILTGYRTKVEAAWSPATAHPDYEGKAGDPAGQCGVTSAWLQRRLAEDHGVETIYCVGDMHWNDWRIGGLHCWLEAGEAGDPGRVVIDLTADQFSEIDEVVCDTHDDLMWRDWVEYEAMKRLTPEDLLADAVRPRLALLEAALRRYWDW